MTEAVLAPRRPSASDWPAIEAGFAQAFVDARSPDVWGWRYRAVEAPKALAWMMPASDGSVLAFAGGTVRAGRVSGEDGRVLVPGDYFRHPVGGSMPGGRGAMARTEAALYAEAGPQVALACNFRQARYARVSHRLGNGVMMLSDGQWLAADPSRCLTDESALSVCLRPTAFEDREWDAFWAVRCNRVRTGVVRDRRFLAWRFDRRWGEAYRAFAIRSVAVPCPLGFLVFRPDAEGRAMVLVDAALPPMLHEARHAWLQACRWLAGLGVTRVVTFSRPANPEHAWWSLLGWSPCAPLCDAVSVARTFSRAVSPAQLDAQLVMTLGDGDLY